jgi:hypothetical protein
VGEDQVWRVHFFLHQGECPPIFDVVNAGDTHEEDVCFGTGEYQKPVVCGIDSKNRPEAKVILHKEWSRISQKVESIAKKGQSGHERR